MSKQARRVKQTAKYHYEAHATLITPDGKIREIFRKGGTKEQAENSLMEYVQAILNQSRGNQA